MPRRCSNRRLRQLLRLMGDVYTIQEELMCEPPRRLAHLSEGERANALGALHAFIDWGITDIETVAVTLAEILYPVLL